MMAIHATHTNLLLLSVQDNPAFTMANHTNSKLQLIVECLILLRNRDNSEIMTPSLLLFCIKYAPANLTAPLANLTLQSIVDFIPVLEGAHQVAPTTICNNSLKFIVESILEGAGFAPTTALQTSIAEFQLVVKFNTIPHSEGESAFDKAPIALACSEGAQFAQTFYQPGNLDS